jgi:hypothetical protein
MRKRRTFLIFIVLVSHLSPDGDLHTVYEVVQIGEAVAPRWICIKVIVGGELKGTTTPRSSRQAWRLQGRVFRR